MVKTKHRSWRSNNTKTWTPWRVRVISSLKAPSIHICLGARVNPVATVHDHFSYWTYRPKSTLYQVKIKSISMLPEFSNMKATYLSNNWHLVKISLNNRYLWRTTKTQYQVSSFKCDLMWSPNWGWGEAYLCKSKIEMLWTGFRRSPIGFRKDRIDLRKEVGWEWWVEH